MVDIGQGILIKIEWEEKEGTGATVEFERHSRHCRILRLEVFGQALTITRDEEDRPYPKRDGISFLRGGNVRETFLLNYRYTNTPPKLTIITHQVIHSDLRTSPGTY